MSKFTKYLERAVDSAKPEKEAGFVSAITSEGAFLSKIVGNPMTAAQAILHAVDLDIDIRYFVNYICEEYTKNHTNELLHESEGEKED